MSGMLYMLVDVNASFHEEQPDAGTVGTGNLPLRKNVRCVLVVAQAYDLTGSVYPLPLIFTGTFHLPSNFYPSQYLRRPRLARVDPSTSTRTPKHSQVIRAIASGSTAESSREMVDELGAAFNVVRDF